MSIVVPMRWFRHKEFDCVLNIYGNTPSPDVAIYGLGKTLEKLKMNGNFYLDGWLPQFPTNLKAIILLQRTHMPVKQTKIGFYKNAFLKQCWCNGGLGLAWVILKFVNSELDTTQHLWFIMTGNQPNRALVFKLLIINSDSSTLWIHIQNKPFKTRGLLSIKISIFDPLGLIVPVGNSG